ncbi:MAG: bacterial Ig-like domain-containing protein [Oscillospiraceae bacterium]|nr:bacterial Ig-like domain-containing protein [Oscillospiraceae bacterium]
MVKKKSLLQKAISFVTSAVMVLTMTLLVPENMKTQAADYEYAMFPGSTLKVNQGAYNEYNAYSHSKQNAFDLGGNNNYFAPFSGTITKIYTDFNAVVLQSDNKVYWANGTLDYMSVCFVHDNDISNLKVGTHLNQGDTFYQPGVKDPSGATTGTHLHLCVNKGKTNAAIPYFSGDTRPNEALYITSSTKITQTGNYQWTKLSGLSSISVTTPPNTTIYENGSAFSTAGMVVTAKYSDGSTKAVTGYKTSVDLSATGTKNVTISYTESGVTKTAVQSVTVQDLFEGSGTASDPYKIGTTSDLQALADHVNDISANGCYGYAYYIQTADIDLNGIDWVPIGSYYESADSSTTTGRAAFNGKYNGNFHTITGLSVSVPISYAGLFGRCNNYGEISNLAVEGTVSAADNYAGGIVGALCWGSKISGCSFTGTVESLYNTGGIAGIVHQGGYIENCYANAEITATDSTWGFAGGIAGYLRTGSDDSTCTTVEVMNCYFTGTVNGASRTGGITCGVESLSGSYQPELTITNCYYNKDAASGSVNSEPYTGISALSSTLLKVGAELLGDHYTNAAAWQNDGYPVFEWQLGSEGDVNADGQFTVTDLVMLQKWLLCTQDASLTNWQAGDLCADGRIDAFDLAVMKRKLSAKS